LIDINNFDAIEIGLASSKQIRGWSSGEVTKPETINYRRQRTSERVDGGRHAQPLGG
jgi:DNA-directed RNA polymerase beta' subunit